MKAIIFDAFGTLVQIRNRKGPYRAFLGGEASRKAGIKKLLMTTEAAPEQLRNVLPISDEAFSRFSRELNLETASIEPFQETMSVLQSLEDNHVPWIVVSNLAQPYCEPFLKVLGIGPEKAVFSCSVGLMKPDPEIYALALRRLSMSAKDVLMVGDSYRNDVQGPSSLGIEGFLIERDKTNLNDALTYFKAAKKMGYACTSSIGSQR